MAQLAKSVKVALNKGLVTEATPLTFPEDATTSELNVALAASGMRYKRRGVQVEAGGSWINRPTGVGTYSTFTWDFAGGDRTKSFLVVQEDRRLVFYNLRTRPMSIGSYAGELDLSWAYTGGTGVRPFEFAAVKGSLVVAAEGMNTCLVRYNPTTNSFTLETITFHIRDFEYLTTDKRSLVYRAGNDSGNVARIYDTLNSGWIWGALDQFRSYHNALPELTKPYYSVKNSIGWWTVQGEWNKIEGGSTAITNGKHILNLYSMDRDGASGVSGANWVANNMGLGPETTRFTTVASYAGRVFFAGMTSNRSTGRIYFSQVIEDGNEFGDFYSKNDPTAEYLSDLLDTDGGYVNLPDAEGILKLHVYGTSLLVIATNGVWAISGVDDVFRATSYTVNRLQRLNISSASSFVSADGRPYWFSDEGIQTVVISEFKNLEVVPVSDANIKTFFQSIPLSVRNKAIGAYDTQNKQVTWLYGETWDETKYRNILMLDETHGAFLPWKISNPEGVVRDIIGLFYNRHSPTELILDTVVDEFGDIVVDEGGDEVVSEATEVLDSTEPFLYLIKDHLGRISFAYHTEGLFYDWGQTSYDAWLETGYSFSGDLSTYKQMPYLTVLLQKTEDGWQTPVTPSNQSSLFASLYWDGNFMPAYPPQQTYRIHRYVMPTQANSPFQSESSLIQTKIVPRGRGTNLRVRFEAEEGKDFKLLGFETLDAKNRTV